MCRRKKTRYRLDAGLVFLGELVYRLLSTVITESRLVRVICAADLLPGLMLVAIVYGGQRRVTLRPVHSSITMFSLHI